MRREVELSVAPVAGQVLAIQTCWRAQSYLGQTLASLAAAGAWPGSKLIYGDGYDPREDHDLAGWQIEHGPSLGNARAFLNVLMRVRDLDFSRLVFFEDDVVLAHGALDYIARLQLPADAFVASLFTLRDAPAPGRFWVDMPMADFARNQALLLPRATVERVCDDDRVHGWRMSGVDCVFREFWPDARCLVHYPNLVQHIGGVSAVGPQGEQVSRTFVGEDFDCKTWLP